MRRTRKGFIYLLLTLLSLLLFPIELTMLLPIAIGAMTCETNWSLLFQSDKGLP